MELLTVGINHHTAPLSLREKVSFSFDQLRPALQTFTRTLNTQRTQTSEVAILSTCNRTEIYCASEQVLSQNTAIKWLADYHQISIDELHPHLYTLPQDHAVKHAFRVASGLDSMVIGESQILGQFKNAVRTASEAGALGIYLHQLFQRTFAVAKEVRGNTPIGEQSVSLASVAVRLAQRVFSDLSEQKILLIGAGEMIELCATHFSAQQPQSMTIANRTEHNGLRLANWFPNTQAISLAHLPNRLHEFDIILSCTASLMPIIGLGTIERTIKMRKHRPIFIVDLAVPRDVEQEVGALADVYLYTIDDLGQLAQQGHQSRQAAVTKAEEIIDLRVQHFMQWADKRHAVPMIRHLHDQANALRQIEIERAKKMLENGEDPLQVMERLSHNLTKKLIHGPTQVLKSVSHKEQEQLFELMRTDDHMNDRSY